MAVITQEKTQGRGTAAVSRCRSLRRENNKLIPWNPGRLGSQARLRACADHGDPAVQTPRFLMGPWLTEQDYRASALNYLLLSHVSRLCHLKWVINFHDARPLRRRLSEPLTGSESVSTARFGWLVGANTQSRWPWSLPQCQKMWHAPRQVWDTGTRR